MDTDHHDELDGLRTRVAELEELVSQLGQQLDSSANTSNGASNATTSASRRSMTTRDGATGTWSTRSTGSAATPKAGPGTPPPAAAGSPGVAGRLAQLVGLPAHNRGIHHHTRTAHNDLHAPVALPCGDPDRSAAPHVPVVCLLDGLPPRPRRGQGSLRAHECSLGPAGRPLTAPGPRWPGEIRSPGASKEQSPTSRQHKGGSNAGIRAGLAGARQPSGQEPPLPAPPQPPAPPGGPGRGQEDWSAHPGRVGPAGRPHPRHLRR
jgi:hypothetical protein